VHIVRITAPLPYVQSLFSSCSRRGCFTFFRPRVCKVEQHKTTELSLDLWRSSGADLDLIVWAFLGNSPESEKGAIKNPELLLQIKVERAGFWLVTFLYQLLKTSSGLENLASMIIEFECYTRWTNRVKGIEKSCRSHF